MKKTAQMGMLWIVFVLVFGVIVWAVFVAPQLNYWGENAVTTNNFTGLEKLFYENLNLWIGLGLIISLLFVAAVGGVFS